MGSVYIANLNPGTVRHEYHASLIDTLVYDISHNHNITTYVPRIAGGCLGIHRNMSVDHFLTMCDEDEKLEWYLTFDSDINLYPQVVDDLLSHAERDTAPIISGVYMMPLEWGIVPSIFDMKELDDGKKHMVPRYTDRSTYPDNQLVECDGTGAGCLLVHKKVFEVLKSGYGVAPWFAESALDGVVFGEDFTFCVRATMAGFPVRVHTGIEVGHVKNVVLTKDYINGTVTATDSITGDRDVDTDSSTSAA